MVAFNSTISFVNLVVYTHNANDEQPQKAVVSQGNWTNDETPELGLRYRVAGDRTGSRRDGAAS